MQNVYWYSAFAAVGLLSAAYTIFRKRKVYKVSMLFVFYLYAASFSWISEFIVLGLFNSYAYKTGVVADPWKQNLLGHLILNTSLYPAATIIAAANSFHFTWISFFAVVFTLIDYLFVKLGIYVHHWWKYYMTTITVIVFLSIGNYWFKKINEKLTRLTRSVTFFFVALIITHTPAPILLLLGKQYYVISFVENLFGNKSLSSVIIIFFYHLVEAFLFVLFTCVLKKWYWRFMPFVISIASQITFAKMHILIMKDNWNLLYTLLIYETFIAAFILIEKYTLKLDTH